MRKLTPCHEDFWDSGGMIRAFFYMGTEWRRVSTSHPGCFSLGEKAAGIYLTRD